MNVRDILDNNFSRRTDEGQKGAKKRTDLKRLHRTGDISNTPLPFQMDTIDVSK